MFIALACDHGGFELMQRVKGFLDETGIRYEDFGTFSSESCDYPVFASSACSAIVSGECDRGILICGTGIGMSIAANKFPGIRAGLCFNAYMAEMTRCHNDANVLCLGARVIDEPTAIDIIRVFLDTEFSGGRHARRVSLLSELDKDRSDN